MYVVTLPPVLNSLLDKVRSPDQTVWPSNSQITLLVGQCNHVLTNHKVIVKVSSHDEMGGKKQNEKAATNPFGLWEMNHFHSSFCFWVIKAKKITSVKLIN